MSGKRVEGGDLLVTSDTAHRPKLVKGHNLNQLQSSGDMVPDPFFRAGELAGMIEYRNLIPKLLNEGEERG